MGVYYALLHIPFMVFTPSETGLSGHYMLYTGKAPTKKHVRCGPACRVRKLLLPRAHGVVDAVAVEEDLGRDFVEDAFHLVVVFNDNGGGADIPKLSTALGLTDLK